jgi:HAE1 family hydrophobic/amphiphilic exporter-1
VPGGNVTTPRVESTSGRSAVLHRPGGLRRPVLATRDGAPIRVRDVGRAEDGTKEQRSIARLDDVPTVILEVRRQSGANTVAVIDAAKAQPRGRAAQMPSDVRLR